MPMNPPSPSARRYARVLSIAGSDSGGGAGIQADLKTCAALGCYGMTAITAVTAQNTVGVRAIHALPAGLLTQQIDAVAEDIGVDAVKIGMLHDAEVVRAVAAALRRHRFAHVVLDPVMVATSGDKLITQDTVSVLIRELLPLATLVTPNLDEAGWLIGRPIGSADELEPAARELLALGARAVLLKGGHLPGEQVLDLLIERGAEPHAMQHERVDTRNLHGAGCTLSSALAVFLAQDLPLRLAAEAARSYVLDAIKEGALVTTGQGVGPLNHGFSPRATVLRQPKA